MKPVDVYFSAMVFRNAFLDMPIYNIIIDNLLFCTFLNWCLRESELSDLHSNNTDISSNVQTMSYLYWEEYVGTVPTLLGAYC